MNMVGNAPTSHGFDYYHRCYWRCAYVFFATARKCNPHARLLFFSNVPPSQFPRDEIDFVQFFQQQRVETITLPFAHHPGEDFFHRFIAVFYMLDVLQYLVEQFHNTRCKVLLLDSDTVFLRSAAPLWALLERAPFSAMEMNHYRKGVQQPKDSCGLTSYMGELAYPELAEIYQQLYHLPPPDDIPVYGGECFGFNQHFFAELKRENLIERLFQLTIERRRLGLPTLITDEPQFSMLSLIGDCSDNSAQLRRFEDRWIWRNIHRTSDLQLVVWHLPREKDGAIKRIFQQLSREPGSWAQCPDPGSLLAQWSRRSSTEALARLWGELKTTAKQISWLYRLLKPLQNLFRK